MYYTVKTLGCKVNQIDSIRLAESLEDIGLVEAPPGEPAALCVVNTCTVTARTNTQCRQMIRRLVRENPGARVVVTGCYAQTNPEAVRTIPGVAQVIANAEKGEAHRILSGIISDHPECVAEATPPRSANARPQGQIRSSNGRNRAFVQVQDGCNAFCAYCIVPFGRGPLKSEDPDTVVRQVKMLVDQGYPEIVLSGIHLGAYGMDRQEPNGLARLLRRLVRIPGAWRVRLSSVEPKEVDDELIALVTGEEKICPHLHIPLQSGDTAILRRMGRPYCREEFAALVFRLRGLSDRMAIGTDLIAGLPGESDHSFETSCEWLRALPLTHFHVFPYSARPGTAAAAMDGQVSPARRKERAARLRAIGRRLQTDFVRRMKGRVLRVVPISDRELAGTPLKVLSGNYLEGFLSDPPTLTGGIFAAKVSRTDGMRIFLKTES
jgi:threonylcarbamoyladenosine tRNA methylthiotransferase MtaB